METTLKYHTFSTKGLSERSVALLARLEERFFEGAEIKTELFKEALDFINFKKGDSDANELLESWHYWLFMHKPYDRQSLLQPVALSTILTPDPGGFYLSRRDGGKTKDVRPNQEYLERLFEPGLIYPFEPRHYYFALNGDAEQGYRLYLQYQQIIGSRYIANVINDLP